MNRKLALLALVALLAAAGLWFGLQQNGAGRGSTPPGATPREDTQPDGASGTAELTAAPAPAADEAAPGARAQRTDAAPDALDLEHESFALDGARWVEVTVVLPPGLPLEDRPALIGFARKDGGEYEQWSANQLSEALGLDDSFAAEVEDEHHWARRAVGARVRLPFPADARGGVLFVQSRYLHLDPLEFALATTEAVTIAPELGGYVTGRCEFPAGISAPASDIELDFQGRADKDGLRGLARPDGREVRVRADLGFELRALSPSKKYAVVGQAKGFVGHVEMSFGIRPGEHHELVIPFRLGATIAGVVRGDGQPLAGASVRVEQRGRMPWMDDVSVETGPDGAFVLAGVAGGKVTLTARKEGWLEEESEALEVLEGQSVRGIELVLEAGGRITGRVRWPDGSPAAGAEVRAAKLRQNWLETQAEARSEADGRFMLGGLEQGPFEVFASLAPRDALEPTGRELAKQEARAALSNRARARGLFMDQRPGVWTASVTGVALGTPELVLTLQEPLPVHGIVVDDAGAPVRSFSVAAHPSGGASGSPEAREESFESDDGTFTLAVARAGDWSFRASAEAGEEDRIGESVVLGVPQGSAELRLVLPRASSIRGVVLDPAGQPVAEAEVHLGESAQEAAFAAFGGTDTRSGPDGRFELASGLRGGFMHATHDDWAASEPVALELVPGEALVDVVLRLRVGARITGQVFDAEGKPEVGQNVTCASGAMAAMAFGFGGEHSASTDGAGRFAFEHVTPGKVTVTALPSEDELLERMQEGADEQAFLSVLSEMRTASVEVVDGGEAHVVLGSKPKQPVRVFGRVSEAGVPLSEKQVFAFAEGGALLAGMKLATTDAGGHYEFVLDRPGDYVLGVGDGFGQGTGTQFYVAVPEVAELEQDLALPLGRIEGVVLGPDGPAGGVPLRLVSSEGTLGLEELSESNRTSTAGDGTFAFEHLQPGDYALHVGSDFGDGAFAGSPGDARFGQIVVDGLRVERDRALDGLVVRLARSGTLAGLVRDAAGAPAAGVTIFVRDSAGRAISASACTTDAAGRFTYGGIAPGRVSASARSTRLVSGESAEVEIASGETATLELTVSEGTFLRVALLEDDQPVRARLRVLDEAGRRVDDLLSMEDLMAVMSEGFSSRERRVGPLAPGKYTLIATTLDGKDAKSAVRLEAGQAERNVKLRLR